jgi:CRP-like cAMP-binding protein
MIARDGRRWHEVVTEDVLKQSPLFKDGDRVFLEQVILALKPKQVASGEPIITKGDIGRELYLIQHGEVEVLDDAGKPIKLLRDGDVFGEVALLVSAPRNASVRARVPTDLYVLEQVDFCRILRDNPLFADAIQRVAKDRYSVNVKTESLTRPQ